MSPLRLVVPTLLLLAAAPTTLDRGREGTQHLYKGDPAPLWDRLSPDMRKSLGTQAGLRTFLLKVAALGAETSVVDEKVTADHGLQLYTRRARFAKLPQIVSMQFWFDASGTVMSLQVKPEPETNEVVYRTKTPLKLPFDGDWTVVWGGRTVKENYHAISHDQRFAIDVLIMENGKTHRGDGKKNGDYFVFDRPLYAPGDGLVAVAVDGIDDNQPGVMNPAQALGNHVIIDHGNGEFSFLAHFKKGSIAVKTGARVRAGELLGHAGNSGNSSEPHLHHHLQNSAAFGKGDGLPAQFVDYLADGKRVARGEPRQKQVIARALPEGFRSLGGGLAYARLDVHGDPTFTGHALLVDLRTAGLSLEQPRHVPRRTVPELVGKRTSWAATNASFFDGEDRAIGAVVSGGKTQASRINPSWGALVIKGRRARVLAGSDLKLDEHPWLVVQGVPRLVVDGNVQRLKPQTARRTALCTDGATVTIVVTSEIEANAFARWLQSPRASGGLACQDALNLDGGPSTQIEAHLPGLELSEPGQPVPNALLALPNHPEP